MLLTHRCSILCIVQYTIQLCPFMEKRIHLSMQLAKNLTQVNLPKNKIQKNPRV